MTSVLLPSPAGHPCTTASARGGTSRTSTQTMACQPRRAKPGTPGVFTARRADRV